MAFQRSLRAAAVASAGEETSRYPQRLIINRVAPMLELARDHRVVGRGEQIEQVGEEVADPSDRDYDRLTRSSAG